ncbi:MAG: DegV family protein [Anaerolineales bacterium]|nr:DegV family protein [Anaerolineales bacterium]
MPSIAIITDSDASLPPSLAERYNIQQVPIYIHFGTETFKTNVEIDDARLFERVDQEKKLPTTSAPSPGEFKEAFRQALEKGAEAVICFCVSSEVSAVYNTAVMAREMLPDENITVVDSKALSMAQGFIVLEAARAAEEGVSVKEVLSRAMDIRERAHVFGALSTLRYLALSGRVGHIAAGMANLLEVKPILSLREGKLDLLEKVRTRKKAWSRTIQLIEDACEGRSIEQLSILHVNARTDAEEFHAQLCEKLTCPDDVPYAELTPGLSVHTGAGIVGAAFVVAK